jgi:hypothetical protein
VSSDINHNVKSRILALLQKIDEGEYTAKVLENLEEFRKKIKEDTHSENEEDGMAILGYLLKKEYVLLDEKYGILLSKDDNIRKSIKKML